MQHAGAVEGLRATRTLNRSRPPYGPGLLAASDANALTAAWQMTAASQRRHPGPWTASGLPASRLPKAQAAVAHIRGYAPGESDELLNDYRRVTRRARQVVEQGVLGLSAAGNVQAPARSTSGSSSCVRCAAGSAGRPLPDPDEHRPPRPPSWRSRRRSASRGRRAAQADPASSSWTRWAAARHRPHLVAASRYPGRLPGDRPGEGRFLPFQGAVRLVDFTGRVALTAPAVPLVGLVRDSPRPVRSRVVAPVVLLRLTYLTGPLYPDEAGYLSSPGLARRRPEPLRPLLRGPAAAADRALPRSRWSRLGPIDPACSPRRSRCCWSCRRGLGRAPGRRATRGAAGPPSSPRPSP